MKKLVFEHIEAVKKLQQTANETVTVCNQLLEKFKAKHNHFNQPVNEGFAFQLVTDPVKVFDELLRVNSPIKPIAGKQQDIAKLAELTGIDRQGFINGFTIVLPGSKDQYNKAGRLALFKLEAKHRQLVSWVNDQFVLNADSLALACEQFKTYTETPEQLKELEYWENLCEVMNEHRERGLINKSDMYHLAQLTGLIIKETIDYKKNQDNRTYSFAVDYKGLASIIKSMVVVN